MARRFFSAPYFKAAEGMGYLTVVAIIFACIYAVCAALTLHYVFFTAVGIFCVKKFPAANEKCSYGIIIGARNEENVIAALIDSIKSCNYPQEKLKIFVVAHNCTDKTAGIARSHGAIVYEYNNPAECTVGYAYKYILGRVFKDYKKEDFDGFFIINADNRMTAEYFDKMNDAFVYYNKKNVVTSYRNSGNMGENYISCLYGLFFISACRLEARGRTVCNRSTRVSGTGYVFPTSIVEDGWKYVTLTEDWEFSADRIACGNKIMYCDEAEFFDEQPTTVPIMLRQRLRWARGHTLVCFTKLKMLIKNIFKRRGKDEKTDKFSMFDIAVSILPLGAIGVGLWLLNLICIAFSPLFGYDPAVVWMWYGIVSAAGFVLSYLLTFFTGALLWALERKRIAKVGFCKTASTLLLFPFFLLLNVILDVISLFVKNLSWKTIPHSGGKK